MSYVILTRKLSSRMRTTSLFQYPPACVSRRGRGAGAVGDEGLGEERGRGEGVPYHVTYNNGQDILPPCGQTNARENITFPKLRLLAVKTDGAYYSFARRLSRGRHY